jgi:hypothetical protein
MFIVTKLVFPNQPCQTCRDTKEDTCNAAHYKICEINRKLADYDIAEKKEKVEGRKPGN